MNPAYGIGIICGLVIGVIASIFILKATKTDGKIKCKYDERQLLARGKAYAISFWTLVGCCCVYGTYSNFTEKLVVDPFCGLAISVCFAAAVQISYCIWHDAYLSLNEDKKKVVIAFIALGAINILFGIINLIEGEWIENGMLSARCLNMVVGIFFVWIGIVYFIKKVHTKNEME